VRGDRKKGGGVAQSRDADLSFLAERVADSGGRRTGNTRVIAHAEEGLQRCVGPGGLLDALEMQNALIDCAVVGNRDGSLDFGGRKAPLAQYVERPFCFFGLPIRPICSIYFSNIIDRQRARRIYSSMFIDIPRPPRTF
jgi:hypothetical protein